MIAEGFIEAGPGQRELLTGGNGDMKSVGSRRRLFPESMERRAREIKTEGMLGFLRKGKGKVPLTAAQIQKTLGGSQSQQATGLA